MAYLIGTDEAGYGPNFGPLVVSATVWQVPDDLNHADLYAAVKDCITPWPKHLNRPGSLKKSKKKKASKRAAKKKVKKKTTKRRIRIDPRIWIADSKQLYKPGNTKRGLAGLERGVLAAIATSHDNRPDSPPQDWHELWQTLCGHDHDSMQQLPWYRDFDEQLPINVAHDEAVVAADRLAEGLDAVDIRLCRIRSRAIDASQFNELLSKHENKSEVLSHVTLGLAAEQIAWIQSTDAPQPIRVLCDKHGGRNHYAALLNHYFPDHFVEVGTESRAASHYQVRSPKSPIEFSFQAKADNILAVGLASMTSKYLRELAMRSFNSFWRTHDAELRPTAGYPADAKRFKRQIASVQASLGITDRSLWRDR